MAIFGEKYDYLPYWTHCGIYANGRIQIWRTPNGDNGGTITAALVTSEEPLELVYVEISKAKLSITKTIHDGPIN